MRIIVNLLLLVHTAVKNDAQIVKPMGKINEIFIQEQITLIRLYILSKCNSQKY